MGEPKLTLCTRTTGRELLGCPWGGGSAPVPPLGSQLGTGQHRGAALAASSLPSSQLLCVHMNYLCK